MPTEVLIIGSGGHSKVVVEAVVTKNINDNQTVISILGKNKK